MDRLSAAARSALMSRIGQANTSPERRVRRILHRNGLRFRLHRRDLPGTPDIVLPSRLTAIFVHGCFWHQHKGCRRASLPSTNPEKWRDKFERNVARDAAAYAALGELGWQVIVVWECELKNEAALERSLRDRFTLPDNAKRLESGASTLDIP
ncbi:very short patch repair endonuclease [Sphingomonas canadensis]|uniref:Very short patch repair endonuclease n=2 Tax=Sphingomonas canadensis TaxID=1219257 RepID=A0ABW3H1M2_9SPHN|nr:DNA mismatch endonuclease Vsr [Sphingomonas canadensis]